METPEEMIARVRRIAAMRLAVEGEDQVVSALRYVMERAEQGRDTAKLRAWAEEVFAVYFGEAMTGEFCDHCGWRQEHDLGCLFERARNLGLGGGK